MKFKLENEQLAILFLLIIGLIAIGLQNSYVGMYYDDFGNASLSYGATIPDVEGTNYTFGQLMDWAVHCYFNWGGRILYAVTFIIPLLKNGISAFMNVQSVVMILICAVSSKIICFYTEKKYAIPSILMLYTFYGLIGTDIHAHGTYWASASILYLWPLLPLLLSCYLYLKTCEKIKAGQKVTYKKLLPPLVLLLFFAACSQEQVGLSVIVYIIFYIGFHHLKEWKQYKKLDITVLSAAVISYAILFCSPGNFARLGGNTEFAELGFFEKLAFNMPRILGLFFMEDMTIFNLLLLGAMLIMAVHLMNANKTYRVLFVTTLVIGIVYLGLLANIVKLPFFVLNCFYFIFLVNLVILSLFYFQQTGRMAVNAFVMAGGASVFCLLYSPVVLPRCYIEYIFIVFILLSILFLDCYRRYFPPNAGEGDFPYSSHTFRNLFRIGVLMVCLFLSVSSALNFTTILKGYKQNAYALEFNHRQLQDYSQEEGNTVCLAKLPNQEYRGEMPYDMGFEHMEYWIKEYYNIPQSTFFQWGGLEVGNYLQITGDFYEDGWFGKEGQVIVDGTKVSQIGLNCFIPDMESPPHLRSAESNAPIENRLICTVGGETTIFDLVKGDNQFTLDLINYTLKEIHVKIEAEATYNLAALGVSTDERELSMVLRIYQK